MSQLSEARKHAFQRRFPGRELMSLDDIYQREFASEGLPRTECNQALALIADELALPAGLLRPTDKMADLLKPLHAGNPLRWIEEWSRAADGKSELNQRVAERLQVLGTLEAWRDLPTVGDVVRAWCGRVP